MEVSNSEGEEEGGEAEKKMKEDGGMSGVEVRFSYLRKRLKIFRIKGYGMKCGRE